MMTFELDTSGRATLFGSAATAAEAIAAFDQATDRIYQFDVSARFLGGERSFEGYEVRVKDLDGFLAGMLREANA